MAEPTVFDPEDFKRTTARQWQRAAAAWHHWSPTLRAWLGPVTEVLLDLARLGPGDRVLDVAAGTGEAALAAAARVGPDGTVLAIDIAANMLAYAEGAAFQRGLANLTTRVMDGEHLTLPDGAFDAALSRLGLSEFPDQRRALAELRRVLRPGGRVALAVWSTPANNPFLVTAVPRIRRAPPPPAQPGPFSLGGAGVLATLLREAGFADVDVQTVAAPLRLPSAAVCARFAREAFGAWHRDLADLPPDRQHAAWDAIELDLRQFEAHGSFVGPCELLVGGGAK
jgi:SAM-dependent methyltransferase